MPARAGRERLADHVVVAEALLDVRVTLPSTLIFQSSLAPSTACWQASLAAEVDADPCGRTVVVEAPLTFRQLTTAILE